jgi:transposase-like protein
MVLGDNEQFTAVARESACMAQFFKRRGDMGRQIHVKEYAAATFVMISKCANPRCSRQLLRLEGGRFYGFAAQDNKKIEHFWLCARCSRQFTLRQIEGRLELLPKDRKSA